MTSTTLITGGNRGLGLATGRRLGAAGATVVIGSRNPQRGELAATELRNHGVDAWSVALDVEDPISVEDAVAAIGERHGRLDLLVNNAGILPEATAGGSASVLDLELLRRTFETNVFGAARMIDAALPLLLAAPAGRIVNVSSTMGSLADQSDPASPYYGVVVPGYQASKAALNSLTIAVAKRLAGTTVTVASVCPGWVQTDLGGPDNRAAAPLTADQAAEVVVRVATAPADEVGGRFLSAAGTVPW